MPTNKTQSKSQTEKKPNSKELLIDLIQKQYGLTSAVVMEDAMKNQKKQLDDAMLNKGMSMEQVAQSKGIDLGTIGVSKPAGEMEQTQTPQANPKQALSQLIQSKPASSPFGFGGMTQKNGQMVEQQPGLIAGLLSALVTGNPKTSARMDLQKLIQLQKGQGLKNVYGFDPSTGNTTLQAQVPENADVRSLQPQTGIEKLPPEERSIARAMARRLYGVRGAERGLSDIVDARLTGMNFDEIEDKIRLSTQSQGFEEVRDAVQTISVGDSESTRNVNFDALDDYIQRGDKEGAKDYIKQMALDHATTDQQNQYYGKERTIDFLGEIENDLDTLEKKGIPTGFWVGSVENLMAKVGQVREPELRKLATKVAVAVMNYRRSMTGVQFSVKENAEYFKVFPDINKIKQFNSSSIRALKEAFRGDLDTFYSLKMGRKNYKKLFGEQQTKPGTKTGETNTQTQTGWTKDKESRYQELLKKRGQ